MLKKITVICFTITLIIILTGCVEQTSLDAYAYALYIGIDKGENDELLYTFMVQLPGQSVSEADSGGFTTMKQTAPSLDAAIRAINQTSAYKINLSRAYSLVFSQLAARDCDIMNEFLKTPFDEINLNYRVAMMVSECRANDYLDALAQNESVSLDALRFLTSGKGRVTNLARYIECVKDGRMDTLMVYVRIIDGTQSVLGAALFNSSTMVLAFNKIEAQLIAIAINSTATDEMTLLSEKLGEMRITGCKKADISLALGDKPAANVNLNIVCTANPASYAHDINNLEHRITSYLQCAYKDIQAYAQLFSADPFGFGRIAAKNFDNIEAWESYAWQSKYRQIDVKFNINLELKYDVR